MTDTSGKWVLTISLVSHTAQPLSNESYYYHVYAIAPGATLQGPEYLSAADFGNPGTQGETVVAALQKLKSEGFLTANFPVNRSDASVNGFAYYGQSFPAQVRYHLRVDEDQIPRVAIVYAHAEHRWGKDLSWTRVLYPTVSP